MTHRFGGYVFWNLLIVVLYSTTILLSPSPTWAFWDGFELFVPSIFKTHSLWLSGEIPLWNAHQHMGEPLLSLGQFGVFYFPYTFLLFFSRPFGIEAFVHVTVLAHLLFGFWGYKRLAESLSLPNLIVAPMALAFSFAAGPWIMGGVWIHVLVISSWGPWMALGLLNCKSKKGFFVAVMATAAVLTTGHLQQAFFILLAVYGVLILSDLFNREWSSLTRKLTVGFLGVGLSTPTWGPILENLKFTARNKALPIDEYLGGSLPFDSLLGIFSPFYKMSEPVWVDSALLTHWSFFFSLAVVSGLWLFNKNRDDRDSKLWLAAGLTAFLILLLSLGKNGGLYTLLHSLPMWGSFKLPPRLTFSLGVPIFLFSAVGFKLAARHPAKSRKLILFTTVLLIVFLTLVSNPDFSMSFWLFLTGLTLCTFALYKNSRTPLIAGIFLSIISWGLEGAHKMPNRYSMSLDEAAQMNRDLSSDYRLLPLSFRSSMASSTKGSVERGLFQFASLTGYRSVTGSTTALHNMNFLQIIPSSPWGLLAPQTALELLKSPILDSYNVRYFSLPTEEESQGLPTLKALGLSLIRRTPNVLLFEKPTALPRFFAAKQTFPLSEDNLNRFFSNQLPALSVLVEGTPSSQTLGQPRIIRILRQQNSSITLELENDSNTFLVFSEAWDPHWLAKVNGQPTPLMRVNFTTMGLSLPPGPQLVEFRFSPSLWPFFVGLIFLGLSGLVVYLTRRKPDAQNG